MRSRIIYARTIYIAARRRSTTVCHIIPVCWILPLVSFVSYCDVVLGWRDRERDERNKLSKHADTRTSIWYLYIGIGRIELRHALKRARSLVLFIYYFFLNLFSLASSFLSAFFLADFLKSSCGRARYCALLLPFYQSKAQPIAHPESLSHSI